MECIEYIYLRKTAAKKNVWAPSSHPCHLLEDPTLEKKNSVTFSTTYSYYRPWKSACLSIGIKTFKDYYADTQCYEMSQSSFVPWQHAWTAPYIVVHCNNFAHTPSLYLPSSGSLAQLNVMKMNEIYVIFLAFCIETIRIRNRLKQLK